MTDSDRQDRPTRTTRRESTYNEEDNGKGSKAVDTSPLPLTDRSNRLSSSTSYIAKERSPRGLSQTYRSPSSSARQGLAKDTRDTSATSSVSIGSPRIQSSRAVGAHQEISSAEERSLNPIHAERFDEDARPIGLVSNASTFQRPTSISPSSSYEKTTKGDYDRTLTPTRMTRMSDLKGRSDQYRGVKDITPSDRDRSAGGPSNIATIGSPSSRNIKSDMSSNLVSTSSYWSSPRLVPTSIPSQVVSQSSRLSRPSTSQLPSQRGQSSERTIASSSAQAMASGGSDDLVSMTQRLKVSEGIRSSRSSTIYPVEDKSHQHGAAVGTPPTLYQQNHPSSLSTTTPTLPHPISTGDHSIKLPIDSTADLDPVAQKNNRSSTLLWQGHGTISPLHQEPHAATSYHTPYGLPMQPTLMSGQTSPQSPVYGGHQHQHSSDSAIFMYPGPYQQAVPSMTGPPMTQMMGIHSRSGSLSGPTSASPLPPGMIPSLATSGGYMMQQMHHYGPQSPVLVPMPDGGGTRVQGMDRRDLSTSNMVPSGMPMAHQTYGMTQSWIQPSGVPVGTYTLPQPWSGQYEARSPQSINSNLSSRPGHQRVLSNESNHPYNPMGFIPGSMSPPPSSFFRSSTSGRMGMHSRSPSSFSQFSHPRSSTSEVHRSPLLDDFRSKHNRGRQYDLEDVKGSLIEFSTDQYGSRFIQEKLDLAEERIVKQVFDELLPNALTLMTDVFGNYVIQKLFEHGTDVMRSQLVNRMNTHVLMLSLGTYGCRVVQKALEHVSNEEQMRLINELRLDILTCARDQNANHVIQKTLEKVKPTLQIDFIPTAFRNNVYSLASHCYSCRVLQRIFEHCEESQKRPLLDELLLEAEKLMHDQFGNYVIQWILQYGSKADCQVMIDLAKGNVLRLSRHKFASNVMEQVVRAASQEDRYALIQEAMEPISDSTLMERPAGVVLMMKDQYANYVLQRFLELSEGMQKMQLYAIVKPALQNLKRFSTGYAKHLAAIERLLESNIARSNVATMTTEAALPSIGN